MPRSKDKGFVTARLDDLRELGAYRFDVARDLRLGALRAVEMMQAGASALRYLDRFGVVSRPEPRAFSRTCYVVGGRYPADQQNGGSAAQGRRATAPSTFGDHTATPWGPAPTAAATTTIPIRWCVAVTACPGGRVRAWFADRRSPDLRDLASEQNPLYEHHRPMTDQNTEAAVP
jgi:hypothetical protein